MVSLTVIFESMARYIFKISLVLGALALFSSCSEEKNESVEYTVYQVGFRATLGTAVVQDLENGKIRIDLTLNPFVDGAYPAHLHFGGINTVGELAYRLNDMDGLTGKSTTILDNVELSDGSILTYEKLLEMDGSIKVHMADALQKSAVLAYGNIGKNDNYLSSGVTICVGH